MIQRYLGIRSKCGYSKCWPLQSWRTTHQKHQKQVNDYWLHLDGGIFMHAMDLINPWLLTCTAAICCYIFDAKNEAPSRSKCFLGFNSTVSVWLSSWTRLNGFARPRIIAMAVHSDTHRYLCFYIGFVDQTLFWALKQNKVLYCMTCDCIHWFRFGPLVH